ncbi:Rv3235 family protein [Streptomyces sp. NPDC047072]|uniref:Rv3235 family protein n=1 Tax=Streptomyces sp. NPDC047072 TaxID=3154809 RepID=UPI0033F25BEA
MNKVMTRTQPSTAGRPPTRRDSRRPGDLPPRTPGGTPTRTSPGDARPPGSPGPRPRTGPTDNRPETAPTTATSTRPASSTPARAGTTADTTAPGRTAGGTTTTSSTTPAPTRPTASAPADTRAATALATPTVPTQTPRRPVAPQPRPTDLFADLLLAVLSGQRPVHSMLRHTVGRAYDELAWLAERSPLRTRGTRPVVRDIGYYVPRPGAVEAFARIGAGDQLRAMAFRLEQGQDLRWRCTAVELGGPRAPHHAD